MSDDIKYIDLIDSSETDEMAPSASAITPRSRIKTMVVGDSSDLVGNLRTVLSTLGYQGIKVVSNVSQAVDRLRERRFELVFFDARKGSGISGFELINRLKAFKTEEFAIAVTANPAIDDIFELLKAGARGFLLMPFNPDMVEAVITRAFQGPPFCEAIFDAPDRNSALGALVLNSLYRLALVKKHARKHFSAEQELPGFKGEMHTAVDLAYTFCEGHDRDKLLKTFVEMCLRRADGPASRLGRMRVQLRRESESRHRGRRSPVSGS